MSVLTRVQLNPEILTDDSDFVTELVDRARNFVLSYTGLPVFPELSQGYSKSGAGATEDITGISTGTLWLRLNGSPEFGVAPTLANCDTGANTAAELQSVINAAIDNDYGFDEVVVTFAATQYTVTSGRYGETSTVEIYFDEETKHLCQALKLSPQYGGTERPGMADDDTVIAATVEIVEQMYRRMGVEGMQSFGLHQGEFNSMCYGILDPRTLSMLKRRRRLW